MKILFRFLALLAALISFPSFAAESTQEPLTVFAAASLTDSLQKVSDAYTASSGVPIKLSFAASSALAKQIESGARADLFLSADQDWMNYLQERQLIQSSTRADLLGNRLVLIAPSDSKVSIDLKPNAPLLTALGQSGRMAIADPDSVPAGRYGKAALTSLGLWESLEPRLARAENVRVALMYVARGEAPLGIVYSTDARVDRRVRVVDEFPETSHAPITYPVALTAVARPATTDYLRYLRSDAAREIFEQAGFTVLNATAEHGCRGFRFDVSNELKTMTGTPASIAGGSSVSGAPELRIGQLYAASLSPQGKVQFAAPVGKQTVDDGSYAGVFRFKAGPTQTVRVTLSEAAWIDVVHGGRMLESVRHTGAHDCAPLRKTVEFSVEPNSTLVLQISGGTESKIQLAVTT